MNAESSSGGALEPGQHVGHYVVEERIGRGGFGEVWRARHDAIAREVAIKVLHEAYSRDPIAIARFVAEAKAANTADHPNIVQVFDFGTLTDGRSYYVMELLRGRSLKQVLVDRGTLPLGDAMPLFRGIAQAIDAAHAVKLAHRDLKPDNVFVLDDGRVKVIDFGLVKLVGDTAGTATETGVISGTPLYMSPEQFRGRDVGFASDAYSFGALAYHVLVGTPPFVAANAIELGLMHLNEPPPPTGLDAATDRWIQALLAKDPAKRPTSLVASLDLLPVRRWTTRAISAAVIVALVAIVVAVVVGLGWGRSKTTPIATVPTFDIRARLVATTLPPQQQREVEGALPRMLRRALELEPDRRYWLADTGDARLDIAARVNRDGVEIQVWRGPSLLAEGKGPSVRAAIAAAVPAVNAALSATLRPATPDQTDTEAMAVLHAPSLHALRRYRAIVDRFDRSFAVSPDPIIEDLDRLIAEVPTWSRPYALSCLVAGSVHCETQLAAEAAHADPSLDPSAHAFMVLYRAHREGNIDEIAKFPELRLDPEFALRIYQIYASANHVDDAVALLRPLYVARPDLQYAANVMYVLRLSGREADADAIANEWARSRPEADQALPAKALYLWREGDLAGAHDALALRRILLGEDADAWTALCDTYLEIGDLAMARRFVDMMLASTPQHRALGRAHAGTVAILEGRFSVAYDTLVRAEVENRPYGLMSETTQTITSLLALAPYVRPAELETNLKKLDEFQAYDSGVHSEVSYELALLARKPGQPCPAIDAFATDIVERRRVLRLAAAHGCGTCADAVAAGLSETELSPRSTLLFAACAEATHQLGLARDSYQRLRSWNDSGQGTAFVSMIAMARLANVLQQLGDIKGARRYATIVVDRWGNADRAVPEVELARKLLAR